MPTYSTGYDILKVIKALNDRIEKLERSNQLPNSSVTLSNGVDTTVPQLGNVAISKTAEFVQPSTDVPVATGINDIWTVTDQGNMRMYWDGATWQPLVMQGGAINVAADGSAPTNAPVISVFPGIGTIFCRFAGITNHDPVQYEYHISTAAFTPVAGNAATLVHKGPETSYTFKELPDGSTLAYLTTYFVSVIPYDADGPGPASNQASATPVNITSQDISANYVYANNISADQIQAGITDSDIVISGKFLTSQAGQRVEMSSDGLNWYSSTDNDVPSISLPSDPSQRPYFSGDVDLQGATVHDGLSIQAPLTADQAARVEVGAQVMLATGINPPQTAPAATVLWDGIGCNGLAQIGTSTPTALGLYRSAQGVFVPYRTSQFDDTGGTGWNIRVAKWATAGGATPVTTFAPVGNLYDYQTGVIADLCSDGGTGFYVIWWNFYRNAWELCHHDANMVLISSIAVKEDTPFDGTTFILVPTGISYDGTYIWMTGVELQVADQTDVVWGSTGTLSMLRWTVSTGTATRYTSSHQITGNFMALRKSTYWRYSYNGTLNFGNYVGNADFGAQRVVVSISDPGAKGIKVFSISGTTMTEVTTSAFPGTSTDGTADAIAYDGTIFVSHSAHYVNNNTVTVNKHTGIVWTTESSIWWASYQWRRSSPLYTTPTGPKTSFTMKMRAKVSLKSVAIPTSGGTSAADSVQFFIGRNATEPATTAMFALGTASSVTTQSFSTVAFSGTAASSYAVSTFPISGTGNIVSQDGVSIALRGDGSGNVGPLSWLGTTNGVAGIWTPYTPTWTATTTNPVLGNGTIDASYMLLGKTCFVWVKILMGSTTTFGSGGYLVTLPFTVANGMRVVLVGVARDSSATASYPIVAEATTITCSMRSFPTTAGNAFNSLSSAIPFTQASGDDFSFGGSYQIA